MEHLQKSLQPSYLNQFQTNVLLSKFVTYFFGIILADFKISVFFTVTIRII